MICTPFLNPLPSSFPSCNWHRPTAGHKPSYPPTPPQQGRWECGVVTASSCGSKMNATHGTTRYVAVDGGFRTILSHLYTLTLFTSTSERSVRRRRMFPSQQRDASVEKVHFVIVMTLMQIHNFIQRIQESGTALRRLMWSSSQQCSAILQRN